MQTDHPSDEPEAACLTLAIATELQPGAKLRENHIIHITGTGIEFGGDGMTRERWRAGLQSLQRIRNGFHVCLADFISYGTEHFGEKEVEDALVQLEFDQLEATRAMAILSLEREARHPDLTAEHYWVLAHSEPKLSPVAQKKWAGIAVEKRLSAKQLADSIRAGKLLEPGQNANRGRGLATPHGIRQAFDLFLRNAEENDPIHEWDVERKRMLYEELKPIAKVVRDLEEFLGAQS